MANLLVQLISGLLLAVHTLEKGQNSTTTPTGRRAVHRKDLTIFDI